MRLTTTPLHREHESTCQHQEDEECCGDRAADDRGRTQRLLQNELMWTDGQVLVQDLTDRNEKAISWKLPELSPYQHSDIRLGFREPRHKQVAGTFQMSDAGPIAYYLGMQVEHPSNGIRVHQDTLAKQIRRRHGHELSTPARKPSTTIVWDHAW
jgi:ferric-dicitrate binding protein FerR (iron transport regulator)